MYPRSVLRKFRLAFFLGLVAVSTSVFAETPSDSCETFTAIDLNTTLRVQGKDSVEAQCFEVDAVAAGHLWLDIAVPGSARALPRLDFSAQACGGTQAEDEGFTYVRRRAASLWLEILVPGSYSFCVAAQDPSLRLGEYKLTAAFVSGGPETLVPGDPDEDEPDPETLLDERCRLGEVDDHGDMFACATAIHLGPAVAGEIRNGWGDDEDVFTFRLGELGTVEIATTGETDTFGSLYDESGQRLAADDDGGNAANFRMAKTLVPGWYFVRVEGRHRDEGAYRLVVNVR
jgi:hypothetical protein